MSSPERLRVGWPAVAVLLAFVAGLAYFALEARENTVAVDDARVPVFGLRGLERGGARGRRPVARDAGQPPTGPAAADPDGLDQVYDPQRWGMLRSLGLEGDDAGVDLPFEVLEVRVEVVERSGAAGVDRDTACALRVLPVADARFNCLLRVICAGRVLYPNRSQTAGYAGCRLRAGRVLGAEDLEPTEVDGDPRLTLDVAAGALRVDDEGAGVEPFAVSFRLRR